MTVETFGQQPGGQARGDVMSRPQNSPKIIPAWTPSDQASDSEIERRSLGFAITHQFKRVQYERTGHH